jgi:hypothetical protein
MIWLAYFDFQSFETWWLLYVPPGLTLDNFILSPHSACMCFVWMSVQTVIISLQSIKWSVFFNSTWSICYLGKTESLNIIPINYSFNPLVPELNVLLPCKLPGVTNGCLLLCVKLAHDYSYCLAVLALHCMMTVVILKHQRFKGLRQF